MRILTVKSDLSVSRQRASALKRSGEKLTSSGPVTIDLQTTVSGNESAQKTVKLTINVAKKITEVVNSSSSNINSVAKNFEAVDQAGRELFTRQKL